MTETTSASISESTAAIVVAITESATAITEPVAATDATAKPVKRKPGCPRKNVVASATQPIKKKRGRPPKLEEQPLNLTKIESQVSESITQALAELPIACDVGCKKNSKGHTESWIGYKLHIETVDGDIPIAAVLTSASA